MRQVLLTVCMILLSGMNHASADSIKNKDLYKACTGKSTAEQNFCYGFIISAANGAQYYRNLVDSQDNYLDICFPATITNKDLVKTYVDWIKKYPSVFERAAFVGVSSALSTAYSCSEEK